jgi:tetratricopeptide (TPR) repeat protein
MRAACLLVLLGLAMVPAAAPPARPRELTAEEQKHVALLIRRLDGRVDAGAFEEAVQLARQIARYVEQRLGARHWQTMDARLEVEDWQHLVGVAQKHRGQVVRAQAFIDDGAKLYRQGRYQEALPLFRKALDVRDEVLGPGHPHTAHALTNLALCLQRQGKYGEALRLYQGALKVVRKVFGLSHPRVAASYNNVAVCLGHLGKSSEALRLYREALAIRLRTLGRAHPHTASSYNNLAGCLADQGKFGDALSLYRQALAINRRTRGEDHPDTASSFSNVAYCLNVQGNHEEALPLFRKALAIWIEGLGPAHLQSATGYQNVAGCLHALGRPGEALPLYRKALDIRRNTLGELHPATAICYSGVAHCLHAQGKPGEALPLFRQVLDIHRRLLGEFHADTARACFNLAGCLSAQGKAADALPLFRKALEIYRKTQGEGHLDTASGYNGLAHCLSTLEQYADALPLFRKALQIRRDKLGEANPHTALSYNNLAFCLNALGKHEEALVLFRQALGLTRKSLADFHPATARGYHNLAFCLEGLGKPEEALPLHRQTLLIRREALGEAHRDTAASCKTLAHCLWVLGRHNEALRLLQASLPGLEASRFQIAATGFDRALAWGQTISHHTVLALGLARLGQARNAFRHAEASLARGLLDDLMPGSPDQHRREQLSTRLAALDARLLPLLSLARPTPPQRRRREELAAERRVLETQMAILASEVSARRLLSLERIQAHLPADTALVFWLDVREMGEHRACILRREGLPAWVPLPGSGPAGSWTAQDSALPLQVHTALADRASDPAQSQRLQDALRQQRIVPLAPHLKGVRRLLVVPSGRMTSVPVETLTQDLTVSYTPSGSALARLREKRPAQGAPSALVLADPTFQRPRTKEPAAPSSGLLIASVRPGSLAARVGLRPGDVLLQYDGKPLNKAGDFQEATQGERIAVRLWREGRVLAGRLPAGKLGVLLDSRPVVEALAAWRKKQSSLLASLNRGDDWSALPGTRLEAAALRSLLPSATVLLGSDASEQRLGELAASGKLSSFRLLHLATHGEANLSRPEETALILAQDRLPVEFAAGTRDVLAGKKPLEGRLTVGTVLESWKLDADLVVLSACQSGLGKQTSGEGMLGFAHALLQKGARSVLLSRWQVDDSATALLMARFYENLLLRKLKRAEALHEAKRWLRQLPRAEAEKRLAKLLDAVPSAERGKVKRALPTRKPPGPGADRPFAAPYFWAAFVLIGDPD